MPSLVRQARNALSSLDLPSGAEALLQLEALRNPQAVGVVLKRVDIEVFRSPSAAGRMAEIAVELADRFGHRQQKASARAMWASSLRATHRYDAAEAVYGESLSLSDSGTATRADIYCRIAVLRGCQGRPEDGLALVDKAINIFSRESAKRELAVALTNRAYIFWTLGRHKEAIDDCYGALERLPSPRASEIASRVHFAATQTLSLCALHSNIAGLNLALHRLRDAIRAIPKNQKSVAKFKMIWIEGRILIRIGMGALGERRLSYAMEELISINAPVEASIVALELCVLHYDAQNWADVASFAKLAADLNREEESLALALTALSSALKRETDVDGISLIREAQRRLEAEIGPSGCCSSRTDRVVQ